VQAYNAHDLDALMRCYDADAVNLQHPWGRAVHGQAAIRAVYERTLSCFPDIALQVDALIADGATAAIQWQFSGTMRGEFAGHAPTGRRFRLSGCEVLRFAGGQVVEQHGYWDRTAMFDQLGLRAG
jgi:steroid delta-isomerase-like uncharacterized protein